MTDPNAHEDLLTRIGAQYRSGLGEAPPAVTNAASHAFRRQVAARTWDVPRLMLVLAGVGGLLLDLPVLFGAAVHTHQDVAVLHLALAVGFLVCAWRPARYARGMIPVALAAAVLLVLPTAADRTVVITNGLAELSHMPVLIGAAALMFGGWRVPVRRFG